MKYLLVMFLVAGAFFLGTVVANPPSCGAACQVEVVTVDAVQFSKKTQQNKVTLLDVRTPQEYADGHIQKAINIDFNNTSSFASSLDSLDKNKTYLIYCRTGKRSGQALKLMEEKGFTRIVNLGGGIQAWQTAGFSLEK